MNNDYSPCKALQIVKFSVYQDDSIYKRENRLSQYNQRILMKVQVVKTVNGVCRSIELENKALAQQLFNLSELCGPMKSTDKQGKPCERYESWDVYEQLSR